MILGYLLLGWVGGGIAAGVHLASGGSLPGAAGVFIAVGNLTILGLATLVYLRASLVEKRRRASSLPKPGAPLHAPHDLPGRLG